MKEDAQKLVDQILAEVRRQELIPMELARRTDLAYSAVHKFVNGKFRRPTWDLVVKIAQAAGMIIQISGPCRHVVRRVLNARGDTVCDRCGFLEERYAPQKQKT